VVLAGEITSKAKVDYVNVARRVIRDIGYTSDDIGFNADSCRVFLALHSQSPDIAQGVDKDGAGDQGLMFGYACNQTEELMPVPIAFAHRLINRLTDVRREGLVNWLRPDSKSQVTVEYEGDRPVRIDAVVISTQHAEKVTQKEIAAFVKKKSFPKSSPQNCSTAKRNTTSTPPAALSLVARTETPD
jgi:S-adenosylmethionine synthetase